MHQNIIPIETDIGDPNQVQALIAQVNRAFQRLDLLVHNAGMAPVTPLTEQSLDEFDQVFNINVRAVVYLTQQALPLLRACQGNIINIGSAVANQPLANMSVYSASKSALKTLTLAWAKEFAKEGIRVNNIAVGPIDTPIYDKTQLSDEQAQAHKERVTQLIPLGHFGQSEDIANMVAFLGSPLAKFITGADIAVDGGFSI